VDESEVPFTVDDDGNRHYQMQIEAAVGVSGSLVADKPPGASGTEAVRVSRGDDSRVASVDRPEDGSLSEEVLGTPPRRETEQRTAKLLVERLNADGGSWSEPRLMDEERNRTRAQEDGVDCESQDADGATLKIQVTSPEAELQRLLQREGAAGRQSPDEESFVDALLTAIERKAHVDGRQEHVLAIDATDFPAYSLRTVVEKVSSEHSDEVSAARFKAVWVVGPTIDLVTQIG
jgi:hypothetical protein